MTAVVSSNRRKETLGEHLLIAKADYIIKKNGHALITSSKVSIGEGFYRSIKTKLSADNLCVWEAPIVVTDCAPSPIVVDLHATLGTIVPSDQSD